MSQLFLVLYDQSGAADLREPLRPQHIAYRKGLGTALVLAGPLLDDAGQGAGSVIIVKADDAAAASALAGDDPYVGAGVLDVRSITPMRVAMMAPEHLG